MVILTLAVTSFYIETTLLQRNLVCPSHAIFNAGINELFAYKAIKMVYKWHLGVFIHERQIVGDIAGTWGHKSIYMMPFWWKSALGNKNEPYRIDHAIGISYHNA